MTSLDDLPSLVKVLSFTGEKKPSKKTLAMSTIHGRDASELHDNLQTAIKSTENVRVFVPVGSASSLVTLRHVVTNRLAH